MGRFFNELEDWLSAFARFNDSGPAGNQGPTALAGGMNEEAARAAERQLQRLNRAIARRARHGRARRQRQAAAAAFRTQCKPKAPRPASRTKRWEPPAETFSTAAAPGGPRLQVAAGVGPPAAGGGAPPAGAGGG